MDAALCDNVAALKTRPIHLPCLGKRLQRHLHPFNTLERLDILTSSKNYFKKDLIWVVSGWQRLESSKQPCYFIQPLTESS